MITSTTTLDACSLFIHKKKKNIDSSNEFVIPPFQREYSWKQKHWENFFDDLMDYQEGYFLGSMVLVKLDKGRIHQSFEVIDGQQRLTTLSILLLALYSVFKNEKNKHNNQKEEIEEILFKKDGKSKVPRITLQTQSNNSDDYRALLSELFPDWKSKCNKPQNAGNRRIYKAFRYFQDQIRNNEKRGAYKLLSILKKVQIVLIIVNSYHEANTLFTSLNNRGEPLSAVDLIKNSLFSWSKDQKDSTDLSTKWTDLIKVLGEDYKIQERFFRQNYNAFKTEAKSFVNQINTDSKHKIKTLPSEATRSNLLEIYDTLFQNMNALDWCVKNAKTYSQIFECKIKNKEINALIEQLNFIEGSPSYTLLLFLFRNSEKLKVTDRQLEQICLLLNNFFLRRHLTDKPATRTLDSLFASIINGINAQNLCGKKIKDHILGELIAVSSSDEEFKKELARQNLYKTKKLARYILANLYRETDEKGDFWQKDNRGDPKWTIEHIMPQTLSKEWIEESFANETEESIGKLLEEHKDMLGNLTLSAYNSKLYNRPFKEKRDLKDEKSGNYIGYKNGIHLNQFLVKKQSWTVEHIQERTEILIKEAANRFKLR